MTDEKTPEEIKQEKAHKRYMRLLNRMRLFAQEVTAADCAGLSPSTEKVQYKHQHRSIKFKGHSLPRDYKAVEALIDFQAAMEANNYPEAIPLYYYLRRMLGWGD